jgi:hypothetical protein
MRRINRTAVVIKPKEPFVDWLNQVPNEDHDFTLERISGDNVTYLIPEFFGPVESLAYVKKKFALIFENALMGWYTDKKLWPKKRNWKIFQEWFEIEINSEVIDLVNEEIWKEEY